MPNLSTRDGTPTGGVYGFAAMSLELIKKLKPDYVAVAWDKPKTNIRRRKEMYPEYKAGRKPAPPDFYVQIPILHRLLESFGWPLYELDDYEADDILGALALQANKEGIEACLITGDMDALQLVGPLTHVYIMKKGFTDIQLYNPETFTEKYGIDVQQFLDLKSLKGDSSDNIPGVPGIGEKTALQLLNDYETLDGVYEHVDEIKGSVQKKLIAGKDSAYLSKEIARIWTDAPVPLDLEAMDVTKFNRPALKKILTELEFRSLIKAMGSQLDDLPGEEGDETEVAQLTPVTVHNFGASHKAHLIMAERVTVAMRDDELVCAYDDEHAVRLDMKTAVELLPSCSIVTHDARPLIYALLNAGATKLPKIVHDTRVGHFMLDPLDKFRELGEVSMQDLSGDKTGGLALATTLHLYHDQTARLKDLPKLAALARDVEFPIISVLARMEHTGIRLDSKFLQTMSNEFAEKIHDLEKEIHDLAGYEFNIASPSQLADVLYGKLQLPTAGVKRGKTGYSTGQAELDKLRGQHPIIEMVERYREYSKLKSTYLDALPKLVDGEGKLHTTFSLDVAATGRLSSHDPNLQNIPTRTDIGKAIRKAFVPAEDNVFVSADYSQFELRLAAVLAGDKDMVATFNKGADIHVSTAAEVYGISEEMVTKAQRSAAKTVNFGVLYGMSPHGLSAATGMSFGEAKDFIARYFESRQPLVDYIARLRQQAKDDGYVETLFGRRRPTPDVQSSNFIVREAAYRQAINMPIQGTEADLMKMAMLAVEDKLNKDNLGWQVLQIHDSILVECSEEHAEKVSEILKETMENIYPELGIKLQVDVSVGRNWGEL